MNHKLIHRGWLTACLAFAAGSLSAQNMPIIQTKFTADPAPMVYNDTVFLYTTHDEDTANGFDEGHLHSPCQIYAYRSFSFGFA